MWFNNIKSQKTRTSTFLWKIHFWENYKGGQTDPPAFLGLTVTALTVIELNFDVYFYSGENYFY